MTNPLDNSGRIYAIVIDFPKAFNLVPHDRPLTKIATSGVNSKIVVRIRTFLYVLIDFWKNPFAVKINNSSLSFFKT
jgi:hypothetical protein